jgi:hypothetical protein
VKRAFESVDFPREVSWSIGHGAQIEGKQHSGARWRGRRERCERRLGGRGLSAGASCRAISRARDEDRSEVFVSEASEGSEELVSSGARTAIGWEV